MTNPSLKENEFKSKVAKECFSFVVLVLLVYLCYITSGIYHEKMYTCKYNSALKITTWTQVQAKQVSLNKLLSLHYSPHFVQVLLALW